MSAIVERTNMRTILVAIGIAVFGSWLMLLSTNDVWWKKIDVYVDGPSLQCFVSNFGGLLVATVPLTLFWELWGKRAFLDEILVKARIAKELEDAGIVHAFQSFQMVDVWEKLISVSSEIDVFFVYGHSWRSNNREHLRKFLAGRYSRLRVILPDPDDRETVVELSRRFSMDVETLRNHISEASVDFKSLAPDGKKVEVYLFSGLAPHFSYYRFGNTSVFAPYNHCKNKGPVPTLVVRDGGFMFNFLRDEFSGMKSQAKIVK